jgi:hypothetical protein
LATLGKRIPFLEGATLKELRRRLLNSKTVATPSELRQNGMCAFPQGFKANPGLELANAFSVLGIALATVGATVGATVEATAGSTA